MLTVAVAAAAASPRPIDTFDDYTSTPSSQRHTLTLTGTFHL